ncbi:hypothetical protein K493DRAFT_226701, partial [Basidiobolus meristosporus CBS 931.73]
SRIDNGVEPKMAATFDLYLMSGPATALQPVIEIAKGVDSSKGQYEWKIPATLTPGKDYAIRASAGSQVSYSPYFELSAGSGDAASSKQSPSASGTASKDTKSPSASATNSTSATSKPTSSGSVTSSGTASMASSVRSTNQAPTSTKPANISPSISKPSDASQHTAITLLGLVSMAFAYALM